MNDRACAANLIGQRNRNHSTSEGRVMSAYGYKQTVCGVTRKYPHGDSNPEPTT